MFSNFIVKTKLSDSFSPYPLSTLIKDKPSMRFLNSKVTIRVTGMSWYLQLFLYHCAKRTKTTEQERKPLLFTKEGDREKKTLNAIYAATALESSGDVCSVMSPGRTRTQCLHGQGKSLCPKRFTPTGCLTNPAHISLTRF